VAFEVTKQTDESWWPE